MKKTITINLAQLDHNRLNLITNEPITGLVPKEHILVDSDQFSFIYLTEYKDDYTYIVLPEPIWPSLKKAMDEKSPAFLVGDDGEMQLPSFHEELEYIISNIEGNGNYGDQMVEKVEKTFLR